MCCSAWSCLPLQVLLHRSQTLKFARPEYERGPVLLAGEGTEPAADLEENGAAYAWQHAGFPGEEDAGHVQEWPAWDGSAQVSRLSPAVPLRVHLLAGGDGGDGGAGLHGWAERAGHASRSQAIACVRCVYSGPALRC